MSNKLRIAFIALFGVLAASIVVLLAVAEGVASHREAETLRQYAGIGVVALVIAGFVSSMTQELYRLEFRRYLLRVMALTTRRGLSLGHAFLALAEDYDGPRRRTVYRILGLLDEGRCLGEALALGAPKIVPPHVIEAIHAAEKHGRLAETLEAAVVEGQAERSYMGTVTRHLLYPTALVAIVVFLSTFILPQFGEILSQITDGDGNVLQFPFSTALMLRTGHFLSTWLIPIGGILLLLASPFLFPRVRERYRWALDPLSRRIPGLAGYFGLRDGERLCRTLAGLVRAGAPLEEGLAQAGAATGSLVLARSADEAASDLRSGTPADRVLLGLRLPRFVRARAAAAVAGGQARFADALDGLARECQWRRLNRAEVLVGAAYPVTLLIGAGLTFLTYYGVIAVIVKLQEALIPW
jgi:type II secretory pathway component PulF